MKAGGAGSITDCAQADDGEWLQIAYSDKTGGTGPGAEDWHRVDLPHDWLVEEQFRIDGPVERGFKISGIGCYRKLFDIPASDEGKKISLQFDGVMRHSTVWVNGHHLGTHPSGSVPFYYDITDVVRYGAEGRNVVFVKVDATDFEGWWYDGAGIYRHVSLLVTDRLHVGQWGTYATTPVVSKELAEVAVETVVQNDYADSRACELVTEIVDADGRVVVSDTASASIEGDGQHVFLQRMPVPNPALWSTGSPSLYKAVTHVRTEGSVADRYETVFGIRTIEFTSDRGFFLNGERMLIKGLCVHQDFAGVGVALPDSVIEYKLKLLLEMGANAYRSAHHPPTKELLAMCDRMGILVIDENRKLDSSVEGINNLKHMLYRDRNHPCIIAWSLENEEVLEGTVMGARILDKLARTARKIDPTRPVTAALNHGFNEGGYSDVLDVVGYNYGHNYGKFVNDHKAYPNRKIYGSEVSAYAVTRGIYEDDPVNGYCSEYGTSWRDNDWLRSWTTTPEQSWSAVANHEFLAGLFIWSGFDYRGEPSPHAWPVVNSHYGVMDTCGFPKANYYYYQSAWTEKPMIHLFPHWNWQGKEGQAIEVWAYGNVDSIELFLNGRSLGVRERPPHGHVEWQVPYEAGKLTAVGKKEGFEPVSATVETAGPPHHIRLEPERSRLQADGCDASVIRVSIRDADDRLVHIADNLVHFSLSGEGRIIGVGNGDPASHEPDKADKRRVFNGYCLVIVQAGDEPGDLVLRAKSAGLQETQTTISMGE